MLSEWNDQRDHLAYVVLTSQLLTLCAGSTAVVTWIVIIIRQLHSISAYRFSRNVMIDVCVYRVTKRESLRSTSIVKRMLFAPSTS
jgi:hypothetical protein